MYQSECAPKSIRGAIVGAYQWMITVRPSCLLSGQAMRPLTRVIRKPSQIGLLIAAVVVDQTKNRNDLGSYAIPIGIQYVLFLCIVVEQGLSRVSTDAGLTRFAWAIILATGLALLPESPRFLIAAGKDEAAQRSLARILAAAPDSDVVAEQYAEIAASVHHVRSLGSTSYIDCFRNTNRNRLRTLTGISLQALQQLVGINFSALPLLLLFSTPSSPPMSCQAAVYNHVDYASCGGRRRDRRAAGQFRKLDLADSSSSLFPLRAVFYYGTTFFKNSGIDNAFLITIATNVVNVGATVPGLWLTDKAGRRTMLLVGAIGMAVRQSLELCRTM